MKVKIIQIVTDGFGTVTKRFLKGLEDLELRGRVEPDQIIENGQNTEGGAGHLRRLAVTQTPVKDHQLTLMWKTLKE